MIAFVAYGVAQPSGSKTIGYAKSGRAFVRDSAKGAAGWKRAVAQAAGEAMTSSDGTGRYLSPLEGPLVLDVVFYLPRPKGHYGRRGLRLSAPSHPAVRPDATKLLRAVEDGLTGIAYRDDAQVCRQLVEKRYGEPARAEVRVAELRTDGA